MASIAELQAYLRKIAARSKQVVPCPPFHLYLHPTDDFRFYNYAIPDAPVEQLTAESLMALREVFAAYDRELRFEFLHEYSPSLRSVLESLGVPLESENPLLVCTPEHWNAVAGPAGLEIRRLHPESPDEDLAASINTVHRGFGDEGRDATPERIDDLRRRIGRGGAYHLGLLEGLPVAVGAYTAPLDGLTELVGIATLPGYRRRGIAAAITAALVREAFAEGVHTAFLTAADDDASRVYQRAGFWRIGIGLAFWEAGS
jgi:GNAT superfamily N-acetyltransferase